MAPAGAPMQAPGPATRSEVRRGPQVAALAELAAARAALVPQAADPHGRADATAVAALSFGTAPAATPAAELGVAPPAAAAGLGGVDRTPGPAGAGPGQAPPSASWRALAGLPGARAGVVVAMVRGPRGTPSEGTEAPVCTGGCPGPAAPRPE